MRRVLSSYEVVTPGKSVQDHVADVTSLFNQQGWSVLGVFVHESQDRFDLVAERWGSALDRDWPSPPGVPRLTTILTEEAPDPTPSGPRRLHPRSDAVHVRQKRWDRIIIRPDGRADVEFVGGLVTALSEVKAEVRDQTIVVTLNVGTEPLDVDGVVPAVGIESVANVVLPMRIVDGARGAP